MINPENGWFYWGISTKKAFQYNSYIHDQVRSYGDWEREDNEADFLPEKFGNCEVDMLLDLKKKELRMCIVGKLESNEEHTQEAILYDIEVFNGLVPHFNFDAYKVDSQSIQVADIPIEWYGMEAKIEWK